MEGITEKEKPVFTMNLLLEYIAIKQPKLSSKKLGWGETLLLQLPEVKATASMSSCLRAPAEIPGMFNTSLGSQVERQIIGQMMLEKEDVWAFVKLGRAPMSTYS